MPKDYTSIYDQQVVKEGLNPLKKIPGVTVKPIENKGKTTYYEINFTPEAKEYILKGPGQLAPGYSEGGVVQSANIDVSKLPTVRNPDGSVSTVRTIGIEMDGKHYLIPTVIGGRVVSDDEAIDAFKRTGRHLGVFSTREASDEAGRRLHEAEERRTGEKYDENEIERILAPLRQRLEPFFREARAVPRRVKQAAADVTEIGPIIKRSNEIPLTIFDPKSELGGEADAMRHLLFSSQLAQKYGETPAKIVSYLHEYTSPTQSEAQREMDLANDALGREIARSAKDDKQLIELARKYVESGRAKMLPKDQRNSGY
jgi:hypothetical protein